MISQLVHYFYYYYFSLEMERGGVGGEKREKETLYKY